MEKVINEFRVIETEDGYRIEIKGDKERMKDFMRGGHGRRHWRRHRRRGLWGPFGFGPFHWGFHGAPWEDDGDEDESDEA